MAYPIHSLQHQISKDTATCFKGSSFGIWVELDPVGYVFFFFNHLLFCKIIDTRRKSKWTLHGWLGCCIILALWKMQIVLLGIQSTSSCKGEGHAQVASEIILCCSVFWCLLNEQCASFDVDVHHHGIYKLFHTVWVASKSMLMNSFTSGIWSLWISRGHKGYSILVHSLCFSFSASALQFFSFFLPLTLILCFISTAIQMIDSNKGYFACRA